MLARPRFSEVWSTVGRGCKAVPGLSTKAKGWKREGRAGVDVRCRARRFPVEVAVVGSTARRGASRGAAGPPWGTVSRPGAVVVEVVCEPSVAPGAFKVSLTAGAVGAVQSADGTRGRLVASVGAGDGAPLTFVESWMLSPCASVLATAGEGAER